MTYFAANEAELEQLGARLLGALAPDSVVGIEGPLGAGKTTFVRGYLRSRGVTGPVLSPTYAVVHEYPGVAHVDVYRVETALELEQVGLMDRLEHGMWLIEWASRFAGLWPNDALQVVITPEGEGRNVVTSW